MAKETMQKTKTKWTIHHPAVFVLTFVCYALVHAIRKTMSNVKSTMSQEWTPCTNGVDANFTETRGYYYSVCTPESTWNRPGGEGSNRGSSSSSFFANGKEVEKFFGAVDASFLFAYATGLYVSGFIADRHDLRLVLTFGMISTAVVCFIFGPVLEWTSTYSQPAFIILMVINGFLQSTAWPCVVAVMGNWFGKGSRGFVLGLWSSCQSVGNIMGALLASSVDEYGYEYSFLLTSCVLFAFGIVIFFGLVPTPLEVGLPLPDELEEDSGDVNDVMHIENHMPEITVTLDHNIHIHSNGDVSKQLTGNQLSHGHSIETKHFGETTDSITVELTNFIKRTECPSSTNYGVSESYILLKDLSPNSKSKSNGYARGDYSESSKSKTEERSENNTREINVTSKETNLNISASRTKVSSERSEDEYHPQCSSKTLSDHASSRHDERPRAVGFMIALLLPGVIPYSLAYAFLKLVNYAFFFWLPFYLSAAFGWKETEADQLSTWYDVGGIVGGTLAGFVSDRCGRRAVVVVPMLVLGVPMLYIYGSLPAGQDKVTNAAMLTCTGFFIGGVANLISAAISADLGRQEALRGNAEALSTVTGIVDGSGSFGAAIGQVAVPYLQVGFGWKSVFYFFMVAVVVTILCIVPILIGEVKLIVKHRRQQQQHQREQQQQTTN